MTQNERELQAVAEAIRAIRREVYRPSKRERLRTLERRRWSLERKLRPAREAFEYPF